MVRFRLSQNLTNALIAIGLIILLAKATGVLKTVANIDPEGVSISIDLSSVVSFALFGLLWTELRSVSKDIADVKAKIAHSEGRDQGRREERDK